MERSEDIAKLATALAKAQGIIEDAEKDSTNPHFKSKYADLAAIRRAVRKPLSDNGIAYLQLPRTTAKAVEITTLLVHESGEMISETLEIPLAQVTPQAIGSAITYGRRYGLQSIVGLAADDDDAESAEGRGSSPQPRQVTRPAPNGNVRELPPKVSRPAPSSSHIDGLIEAIRGCPSEPALQQVITHPINIRVFEAAPEPDQDRVTLAIENQRETFAPVKAG